MSPPSFSFTAVVRPAAALAALLVLAAAVAMLSPQPAHAQLRSEVQTLDELKVNEFPLAVDLPSGKTLVLNGSGVRKYGMVGLKVYYGALYLESREHRPEVILDSPGHKAIVMRILRGVNRDIARDNIRESLERNCKAPCVLPQDSLKELLRITPHTIAGESQTILFGPEGRITVYRQDQKLGEIVDARFARILLSTWIGAAPATEELKQALLGAQAGTKKP